MIKLKKKTKKADEEIETETEVVADSEDSVEKN